MSRLTRGLDGFLPVRGCHPLWLRFPAKFPFLPPSHWPGPRSLATTNGVSVDVLSSGYLDVSVPRVSSLAGDLTVGFPHSEISGSKPVRGSPKLIAAYYVLHRLSAPRHPLNALKALDRSHYQCPQTQPSPLEKNGCHTDKNEYFATSPQRKIQRSSTKTPWHPTPCGMGFDRSDQKTRNHVAILCLAGGNRLKRNKRQSLYNVDRSGNDLPKGENIAKLYLFAKAT